MSDERKAWSILIKTEGGVVSILRDLTLSEAKSCYQRLDPNYGRHDVLYQTMKGGGYMGQGCSLSPSDINLREVFGPEDWDRKEVKNWRVEYSNTRIDFDDPQNPYNPDNYKNGQTEKSK